MYAYDDDGILYDVVIDASSGRVLARSLRTDFAANDATVWPYFPQSTGTPSTVNLGADPTWIDRSTLDVTDTLVGNNAHAYADIGAPNGYDAGEGVPKTEAPTGSSPPRSSTRPNARRSGALGTARARPPS